MRIALSQINSCVGDLEGNTAKIISNIAKAKKASSDIVVFPELALTGYPPEDLLLKPDFINKTKDYLKKIVKYCKGITVVAGFVDNDKNGLYNSCAVIQEGRIKSVYNKMFLPNYGVFDEQRYFKVGETVTCFSLSGYKFAVTICEDLWSQDYVKLLAKLKLDFIINASASPFHLGKVVLRKAVLSYAAIKSKAFLFYCNLVGGQDELVFDGTSKVVSTQGKVIAVAARFKEDLLIFDLDKKKRYPAKAINCSNVVEVFSALKLGLADYVKKNGFKKVVIGISGGIDSAVVAALAVSSLGKDNVKGLILPSRYTSQATYNDALALCRKLKISYDLIKIDPILKTYLKMLKSCFKGKAKDKTEENLQARIRGALLMAYSNKHGHLVLNTGNKSEVSCGYCTLYGDMVGGFGVLKDLPKQLVYQLASYINRILAKPIAVSIIKRAPSAELKSNQKDSDSLPAYPKLDAILKLYVEEDYSKDKIIRQGFNKKTVEKVIKMVDSNEYKRRQAPLGIKITPKAFGRDRRMPVTNRFRG